MTKSIKLLVISVLTLLVVSILGAVAAVGASSITFALDNEPAHLDPLAPPMDVAKYLIDPVAERLIEYNENSEVEPRLAESWEWLDNVTLEFHLRQGVKFHNGEELTVQDVIASFNRVLDPEVGSQFRSFLMGIASIEEVNKYTGVIHLEEPLATLTTFILTQVPICPESSFDTLRTHPVGTGPFVFDKWVKGEKAVYKKFDDYWRPNLPKIDELVFRFMPDYRAMINSLLAGDIDIVRWLDMWDAAVLSAEPGIEIDEQVMEGTFYVGFNTKKEPFSDVRVRRAVKYALQKQAFIDSVNAGYGEPPYINGRPGGFFYPDQELLNELTYERDLKKAKELLAEAGYPDGFKATITVPQAPTEAPCAPLVQEQLKEIGISLDIEVLKIASYLSEVFTGHEHEMTVCGYMGVPDPDFFYMQYLHSDGPYNHFEYDNIVVDTLLEKARAVTDLEDRKELYNAVYRVVAEDVPLVWLLPDIKFAAYRSSVKGFYQNSVQQHSPEYWSIEE